VKLAECTVGGLAGQREKRVGFAKPVLLVEAFASKVAPHVAGRFGRHLLGVNMQHPSLFALSAGKLDVPRERPSPLTHNLPDGCDDVSDVIVLVHLCRLAIRVVHAKHELLSLFEEVIQLKRLRPLWMLAVLDALGATNFDPLILGLRAAKADDTERVGLTCDVQFHKVSAG
jgi:hypothetical protein